MKGDSLGDRMKNNYENRSRYYLPRRTYTIVRLDGKSFHTYTKGLNKPFDEGFIEDMAETTKYLCENIQGCKFGYVQSDEISLLLTDFDTLTTDAWFDGNIQKIVSVSASLATAKFNQLRLERSLGLMYKHYDGKSNIEYLSIEKSIYDNVKLAMFDSRVFTIPSRTEVINYFIWRQQDAVRNSIQGLAQSKFSHKELEGKNTSVLQEMMFQKDGTNWDKLADNLKRGSMVVKEIIYDWEDVDGTAPEPSIFSTGWEIKPSEHFKYELELFKNVVPTID